MRDGRTRAPARGTHVKLTIDGTEVEAREGASVLDAALDAGVFIPHICKHPDLEAVGGCRLCSIVVDGEGPAVPACKTPVREGMVVDSHAKAAEDVRRMAMELILATHPSDCTGCPKYGVCELQSMYQYLGVSPARWRCRARTVATDDTNPLITHMFTRCIRCGRCVRACRELRGVGVLDYQRTPEGIRIGIDGGVSLEEAGCRFCGACVEVCPTGSIVDTLGLAKEGRSREDNVVPCRSGCPAHIDIPRYLRHVKNGEWEKATAVVRERVPFPETLGSICTHNCQGECKRNHLEGPLSICRLKRAAAVRDTADPKRARLVIVTQDLLGQWCYKVKPTLKRRAGADVLSVEHFMEQMPDSLRGQLDAEREYGFTLKVDSVALPIGYRQAAADADAESPLEYPALKRYRQWYIRNGQLLLTEARPDSLGNATPAVTDTAELVMLTPDTLVLRFPSGEQSYYRKQEAKE